MRDAFNGLWLHVNRERSHLRRLNSATNTRLIPGVRDTEEALTAPEIVLLGDSFALGWGVDQAETFIKLVENRMKLKTLNTCVPSFGTVREMLMLRKVNRSQLKYLILQYCADDYDENRLYYKNGNRPQLMRAETFQNMTTKHSKANSYYPGKYIGMKINKSMGNGYESHASWMTTICRTRLTCSFML